MKCLVVLLLLSSLPVRAAIINAASTSRADVSNAWHNLASNGDTIILPGTTSSWAEKQFFTNKAVRLTGAGIGNTIIRDTCPTGPWITIWLQPGLTTTIDNIEFEHVGASAAGSDRFSIYGMNNDNSFLNVFHCRFEDFSSVFGPVVFGTDTAIGVVHHNQFWGCGLLCHVKASYYDGTFLARDYGNGSMFAPDYFGTTNFVFFEDNFVTNSTGATDAQAGGRYVYRWNTNYNFNIQTHGSEAAERSGRAFEVYKNIFHGNGAVAQAAYMRGGVTLIYSNTYDNWPVGSTFNLLDNRVVGDLFPPFGGATGVNSWDTNHSTGVFASGTIANTGGPLGNLVTDFSASMTANQYAHHQILLTSGKSVTSITRVGSVATATVTAHGITNGATVTFWGADQYGWNRGFTATSNDANTLTFTTDYAVPNASGTILCISGGRFGRVLTNSNTNIFFADAINAQFNLRMTNGETYEIRKLVATMDQVGLYGGTNFGTTAYPDVFSNFAAHQTVSVCYQWDNVFLDTVIPWTTGFAAGGDYANIISGRHYSNNVAKPAYTGYTYPHPRAFILGAAGSSTTNGIRGAPIGGIRLGP